VFDPTESTAEGLAEVVLEPEGLGGVPGSCVGGLELGKEDREVDVEGEVDSACTELMLSIAGLDVPPPPEPDPGVLEADGLAGAEPEGLSRLLSGRNGGVACEGGRGMKRPCLLESTVGGWTRLLA
jgi:hypothetical protein